MAARTDELYRRITNATALDAEMRQALQQRLRTMDAAQAQAATESIERIRDKSLELRRLAEQKRKERSQRQVEEEKQAALDDLIDRASQQMAEVLRFVSKSLANLAITPQLAAPILRAGIDKWTLNYLTGPESTEQGIDARVSNGDKQHSSGIPISGNFVVDRKLQTLTCLDALTKLEVFCRVTGVPENVVGINSGGHIVAQYLAKRLNLSSSHVFRINTHQSNATLVESGEPIKNTRILIVDDVVRTGRTMSLVQNFLVAVGIQEPRYASIVTSLEGKATLGSFPVYSPVCSAKSDVKVPWATSGSLTKRGHSYIFGDPAEGAFAIDDRQAEVIVREVSAANKFGID